MVQPSWMPKLAYEWHTTPRGNIFWGPRGAAGILFHHPATDTYLLGHRSPEVHHGNTWGIPGGAIDPGESPYQAALREAEEEFGHVPQHKVLREHVASPDPDWNYTTYVADVPQQFDPEYAGDWETQDHGWFTPDEISKLNLHPGFAQSWYSGGLTKQAMRGFFYHTAPREHRESIEQNGLVPTDEAPVSPWANADWDHRHLQPQGVYMWDHPGNARNYAYSLYHQKEDDERGRAYGEPRWHLPGDNPDYMPEYYESPAYEAYEQAYPGEKNEYGEPVDEDDYYDYMDRYQHEPEPLYDIWKVNTLGYEPELDPEAALGRGELTAEEAQREINEQQRDYQFVDPTEGHRWYLPHAIEPGRLTLHESIYPNEMTQEDEENLSERGKQIPESWSRVPLDQWNEKARRRYLGDPRVMQEIAPQDRSW